MNKIMIDLETMGLNDKAPILSIGAVAFNETEVTDTFYVSVSLESSMSYGLVPDASTIKFWMYQPDDARIKAMEGDVGLGPSFLALANWWYSQGEISEVWANGNKDFIWLKSAAEALGNIDFEKDFFPYYKERDFRTAKALLPRVTIPDEEISHHAMYDARWQANYLIKALQEVKQA